jgi:hypothetical protein
MRKLWRIAIIEDDEKTLLQRARDVVGDAAIVEAWDLNELSGATVYGKVHGINAVQTACTLNQPGPTNKTKSILFDGSTSYINIYSTELNAAFTGGEFSIITFAKAAPGAWVDGALRFLFHIYAGPSNYSWLGKNSVSNIMTAVLSAGGTVKQLDATAFSPSEWFAAAVTVTKTGDRFRLFAQGAQVGVTATGLGTWSGNLQAGYNLIGAQHITPLSLWSGYESTMILFRRELTPAEVAAISGPFELRGVTAVGDSKTSGSVDDVIGGRIGWPAWLCDDLSSTYVSTVEMKRVGVGGIDSATMKDRSAADAAVLIAAYPTGPRDIIIGLGVNDADIASPPDQATFEANMMIIANSYHAACPSARIWLTLCYYPSKQVWVDAVVNAGVLHMIATNSWLRQGIDERAVLPGLLVDTAHPGHPGHLAYAAAYAALIA